MLQEDRYIRIFSFHFDNLDRCNRIEHGGKTRNIQRNVLALAELFLQRTTRGEENMARFTPGYLLCEYS